MDTVYTESEKCSGCGYCLYICKKKAISMREDSDGYIYPVIDQALCIDCGVCRKTCPQLKPKLVTPVETYSAYRKSEKKREASSSGGAFAAVAEKFLREHAYVCGAAFDENFNLKQRIITSSEDLKPLLGSKYVQSSLSEVFPVIKERCKTDKVLFCGTPCQVNAIKQFVSNSNNLYTIDIICHGVPPLKMFQAFLTALYPNAESYNFRDKRQGWSFDALAIDKNGKKHQIKHRNSSWMSTYFGGTFYRESCFSCPFANEQRCGDLTIGDFWGIIRQHPELKHKLNIDKGVSCILVNNEKGKEMLQGTDLVLYDTAYAAIRDGNGPLNHPSKVRPERREKYFTQWRIKHDWADVDAYWKKNERKIPMVLWAYLPKGLKNALRIVFHYR